jgi:hypothetical protein
MPGRAARRREPSHAISPHRPATRHAEALLAADTHWIDLSRRVSRSPLVMHPEPGGRTPRSEHEIRAVLRGLGPAARGVGRCEAGKPVEAQLLYVSSVSGCGPGGCLTSAVDTAPAQRDPLLALFGERARY